MVGRGLMPSPYVKKGYGEVSKKAEDRILEEITIICKACNSKMMPLYLDLKRIGWVCRDDNNSFCTRYFCFPDKPTQL